MQEFDKISIAEIPKKDMLLIIRALEYTGKKKELEEYLILKRNIIKDLSYLADSSEEEFINYLEK
ncbi:hypothetical protein GOQ29_06720 [Clostridium sp. D2Q-14]|uniref:hypothetical protein n=1 Tax=Anaeromonas gelatinilytica TaxID=2683194 RepID=UPI00193C5800|nr:hypothetical protein [Anaeromonas gelatinilytica]MBS4535309.1 hypothetical protein [Anaeromonas gelatinilytica]